MHILDLDIGDSNLNPRAFKVQDNSVYDKNIEVKNGILEITPPGFSYSIVFKVKRRFSEVLNSTLLNLNTSGLRKVPTIPDGNYLVKYSVDPNTETGQTYNYFRTVMLQNKFFNILTVLLADRLKYSNKEFEKNKQELIWLGHSIKGCKILAEDGHQVSKAIIMYKEIDKELKDFKLCSA